MDIQLSNIQVHMGADRSRLFRIPQLHFAQGTRILIKGASGKGKTTFLHLLAGLFLPTEGQVKIGETEISRLSDEQRARFRRQNIGMIFQKLNLIDHLTALENIELATNVNTSTQKARESLAAVGLGGREFSRTSTMSLGEQQRIAIARVLVADPAFIFADEPTSSLDDQNAHTVMQLILDSCKDKTLIVVSHDHRIEKYFSNIKDFAELIG